MFKHFRVILRITPRDIGNFFKAAWRFIKSLLPAFLISFSILTAFSMPVLASTSGGLVTEKPTLESLPKSQQVSYKFYKDLYDELNKLVDDSLRKKQHIVSLNRLYYFSLMLDNSLNCSSSISSGNHFTDDYLWFYFNFYLGHYNWSDGTSVGFFTVANEDGIITNVDDIKFNIENLCFFPSNWNGRLVYYTLDDPPDCFKKFKDYYNYLYSLYLSDGSLSSGSLSGIADPVISGSELKDIIASGNTLFFPKNFNGKVSYRNDKVWHNKYDSTSTAYDTMEFYTSETGFSAVGGGDEIYLIFFEKLGDVTYYHKYQFHFTVNKEDVWYTDRDEIQYTNYRYSIEYWDMVDGSSDDEPTKCSYYDLNSTYRDIYYRIYFSSVNNVNYKGIKFYPYDSYSSYLNYIRHSSSNDFFKQFIGYNADLLSSITMSNVHFTGALSTHDQSCAYNGDCDFGYIASLTPITTTYKIDTSKIPDNYYITINGDTIYDYSITNPETGAKDTINNYITNNYTLPDPPATSQPTTGGNGGGNVNVDVDVTVNIGGNGNHYDMPDTSFFDSYLDNALEESTGIRKFIGDFFNTLPGQITQLIGLSIVISILCRLIGR